VGVVLRAAALPARRRLLGSLIIAAGLLVLLLGFFVDLSGTVDPSQQQQVSAFGQSLPPSVAGHSSALPLNQGVTAAATLHHAFDHGLANSGRIATIADAAFRGGVGLIALAGAVALLSLLMPTFLRGLAGLIAGLGLAGCALVAGVLVGERTRLTLDTGPALHVNLGSGVWVCAAGLAIIMLGGVLAAVRALPGVIGGLSLTAAGAAGGAVLALLIGGDRIA